MRRQIRAALGAVVLAAVVGLTACSSAEPEIAGPASETMQSTVVFAAEQAASGDTTGALATLDVLEGQLEGAVDAGDISADRATAVRDAIDLVRTDLQAIAPVEPVPAATVAPEIEEEPVAPTAPDVDPDSGGNGGKENGNGNGNGGNGSGKGNGGGNKK